MTVFEIKFYYDTICPWCYIGLRSLDRAMSLYQKTYPGGRDDTFSFAWVSFYLDKNASMPPISQHDRIIQKNGETIARGAQTRLQRLGQVYGINFTFKGKVGNSRMSHRLMQYAGTKGPALQWQVIEMIFERHFESTGDINDEEFLLEIARDAGLDEAEVLLYLGSDAVAAEVDSIADGARAKGINHVPTVELNGMRIEGADEPGEFYEALVKVRELA